MILRVEDFELSERVDVFGGEEGFLESRASSISEFHLQVNKPSGVVLLRYSGLILTNRLSVILKCALG